MCVVLWELKNSPSFLTLGNKFQIELNTFAMNSKSKSTKNEEKKYDNFKRSGVTVWYTRTTSRYVFSMQNKQTAWYSKEKTNPFNFLKNPAFCCYNFHFFRSI